MNKRSQILLFGLLTTLAIVFADFQFVGAPLAFLDVVRKDFGDVETSGPVLEWPFRWTNSTEITLHVKRTRSSCSCLAAEVETREILPGRSLIGVLEMVRSSGPRSAHLIVDFEESVAPLKFEMLAFGPKIFPRPRFL